MADEQTGTISQDAADKSGGSTDSHEQVDGQMVPLSALEGAREELKSIKESNQALQAQVEVYRANQANIAQKQEDDAIFEGLSDNDVVTVADVKKILNVTNQRLTGMGAQLTARTKEPNYEQLIEKYLPGVLTQNPELADAIRTSKNPVALAVHLAKSSDAYREDDKKAKMKEAGAKDEGDNKGDGDLILDNTQNKPGATSTGKGAGGGMSAVDKVLQMTDEELEAKIQEVSGRA